jgi:predicted unusual protein kinase regulating ubiquinone biosynthesis (AarF/ABC1/UbiB family)
MASDVNQDSASTAIDRAVPARAGLRRSLTAYWTVFVIFLGYVWARWAYRFRSARTAERLMRARHQKNARRIHRTVTRLQGLFIKVGQLISIMTNFLPEAFRRELETLQDRVPPHPYRDMERRIAEEFEGRRPHELFASFTQEPLAAASIGQVHRAKLADGTQVAVKIQYPEIERIVHTDLQTLYRIFIFLERFLPEHGLSTIYAEIRSMVLAELDFAKEAQNLEEIAGNFAGRQGVCFPRVLPDYSTRRVLTTTFEKGAKVSDLAAHEKSGISKTALAQHIIRAYCEQIFEHGLYHADPHPGNILVRLKSTAETAETETETSAEMESAVEVVFLDFGAVARISPAMRRGIAELVQGGIAHDTQAVLRALDQMGFISKSANPAIYEKIVDYFHQRFHEEIHVESLSFKDIKIDPKKGLENLADLKRMNISLRDLTQQFHVPKEWILLERTLLLLMGICTELDPNLNPMEVISPYLKNFVLGDKDPAAFVMDAAKELLLSTVALPGEIRRLLSQIESGRFEVQISNLEAHTETLYRLGHQCIYAGLAVAAGTLSVALYDRGFLPGSLWSAGAAGGLLVLLMGSLWRGRRKRRRG